jgi:hypothetical protein
MPDSNHTILMNNTEFKITTNNIMKKYRNISIILITITAGLLLLRIILAFRGHYLEQVSGSWAALAIDVSKGILYRPLFDEVLGTGGTRWMPLYFVLHGALIKITGNVVYTGLALSLFSSSLLLFSIAMILRHYKITPVSSVIIFALLLCSNNLITAMTAVRGDILASALNICGIYFAVTSEKKSLRIIISCLLFSLTIMTKITSGFGIAAVAMWLFFNDKKKNAAGYIAVFSAFTILFINAVQLVSSGRFKEIFSACAAGGATIVKVLKSPFNFINCLKSTDTGVIVIFTAALTIIIHKGSEIIRSQFSLYMIITLAITLIIFGSDGIVGNHLIDVHIASVLVLAGFINDNKIDALTVVKCSLIVIIMACIINTHNLRQDIKQKPVLKSIKETALLIDNSAGLISQNPWLPIIMKRDVYLLDPWMLRIIDTVKPELLIPFYKRLDSGKFDAMVFDQNPLAPWIPEWFEYSHFGSKLMQHIFRTYRLHGNHDMFYIYSPGKTGGNN